MEWALLLTHAWQTSVIMQITAPAGKIVKTYNTRPPDISRAYGSGTCSGSASSACNACWQNDSLASSTVLHVASLWPCYHIMYKVEHELPARGISTKAIEEP